MNEGESGLNAIGDMSMNGGDGGVGRMGGFIGISRWCPYITGSGVVGIMAGAAHWDSSSSEGMLAAAAHIVAFSSGGGVAAVTAGVLVGVVSVWLQKLSP